MHLRQVGPDAALRRLTLPLTWLGSNPLKRPPTSKNLSEEEFSRWYWTLAELRSFARSLGLSPSGSSFRFDGHMRQFISGSNGATLGDAIEHWHATRADPLPDQSLSLEFNAFTKEWHVEHPEGSATQCRAAWKRYRSLPVDQRPPVADA